MPEISDEDLASLRRRAADVETLKDILRALVESVRSQEDALDPTHDLIQAVRDAESWLKE